MRKPATKKAEHAPRRSASPRKTRVRNRKKPAANRATTLSAGPVKLVGGRLATKPFEDRGPIGWLLPMCWKRRIRGSRRAMLRRVCRAWKSRAAACSATSPARWLPNRPIHGAAFCSNTSGEGRLR
jgi:hypothetical protein